MFCQKCGKELPKGAKFCTACGAPVEEKAESRQAPVKGFAQRASQAVGNFADTLDSATGGEGHVELRFRDFFVNVPKHHTREEAAEIFVCGTKDTTPAQRDISREWPKPWFYTRVFLTLLLTTVILFVILVGFSNPLMVPGVVFVGAMLGPIPVLVFYFEVNSPRNIPIIDVIRIFFLGGVMSLIITMILDGFFPDGAGRLGPSMVTGFVEELAKAIAVAFFVKRIAGKRYILNGLLIGGAVGAGFAVFETAGYILNGSLGITGNGLGASFLTINYLSVLNTIFMRGILAFGGHVAWAAISGAAIVIALNGQDYKWSVLFRTRFLSILILNIILHGLWDTSFPLINYMFKDLVLCCVAWILIVIMLNRGLKEINALTEPAAEAAQEA